MRARIPLSFARSLSRRLLAVALVLSLALIVLSEFRAIIWFRGLGPPRAIIAKSTILWYVDKTLHQSVTDAAGNVVPPPAALAPPGISTPAPNAPRSGVHLLPVSPYDTRAWLPQRDASAWRPYVYTIAVPLPLIAVPAAILLLFAASPRRYLRRRRGQCLHCGYDLRSLASPLCPECGSPTEKNPLNFPAELPHPGAAHHASQDAAPHSGHASSAASPRRE